MLAATVCASAQDKGQWRPASKTASGVTGEIAFGGEKVTINFISFTVAQIRTLAPAEVSALFDGQDGTAGQGNLYRLSIPGTQRFLHKNTLCGSEDTQWLVTFAQGKSLNVAFFSGDKMPVLTLDTLKDAGNLCGTYAYVR